MVKTWRDSWFEPGLRVFYILPRQTTDRILPIALDPQPTELVRVMVGRAEIITPEMRAEILAAAAGFISGSADTRAAAIRTVRKYGHFAEPVLYEANTSESAFNTLRKLAEAAATPSATDTQRQ